MPSPLYQTMSTLLGETESQNDEAVTSTSLAESSALVRRPLTPDLSAGLRASMGPFFDRLPFELRRRILELAFGNLKVHIFRGSAGAPTKEWWHCLCGREMDEDWSDTLWIDNCHRQLDNDDQTEQIVELGAMGWILTCRQAYMEGIQVLYSTSIFILTEEKPWEGPGNTMVRQLCAELPRQRLASITHLVLIWEITKPPGVEPCRNPFNIGWHVGWHTAAGQFPFGMLQSAFPGLRRLHVSLGRDMLFVKDNNVNNPKTRQIVEEKEEAVLGAADAFVRASAGSRLEELYVSVNFTFFDLLRRSFPRREDGVPAGIGLSHPEERFWRRVDGADSGLKGYWVVQGYDDIGYDLFRNHIVEGSLQAR